MKKTVVVERTLMLSISLTGDPQRDALAVETSKELMSIGTMSLQIRDMVEEPHVPFIFLQNEKGIFSHSMENNTLFIWEEKLSLEDKD
jgi:hypothetical protein